MQAIQLEAFFSPGFSAESGVREDSSLVTKWPWKWSTGLCFWCSRCCKTNPVDLKGSLGQAWPKIEPPGTSRTPLPRKVLQVLLALAAAGYFEDSLFEGWSLSTFGCLVVKAGPESQTDRPDLLYSLGVV